MNTALQYFLFYHHISLGLQYYTVTELSAFPRNGLSVRAGSADTGRHSGYVIFSLPSGLNVFRRLSS